MVLFSLLAGLTGDGYNSHSKDLAYPCPIFAFMFQTASSIFPSMGTF